MRFQKQERHDYEDTRRKRLAVLRWQQNQRDRLPLLAAQIEAGQPPVDAVMSGRVALWATTQQANRDRQAAQWRQGRQELARMEPEARRAILAYWNSHKWLPGTPVYFLDMLHSIRTGQLVPQGATFRFSSKAGSPAAAEPDNKPHMIPGLVRQKPTAGGPRP